VSDEPRNRRQILLARHGETKWNVEKRRQGWLDSPLTDEGIWQAQQIGAQAYPFQVDIIVASSLGRARETATTMCGFLGADVVLLDDLREVNHGDFAGHTNAELDAQYPGWRAQRKQNLYEWRFPGGESYHDAHMRAVRALANPYITDARCPLIISHQMIGRMLIGELEHIPVEAALHRDLPHNRLLVFER